MYPVLGGDFGTARDSVDLGTMGLDPEGPLAGRGACGAGYQAYRLELEFCKTGVSVFLANMVENIGIFARAARAEVWHSRAGRQVGTIAG